MEFVVKQELRNNCYLRCVPGKAPVQAGDDIILIINDMGRKYSVASRVESIEPTEGAEPEIVIDQRILEGFPENKDFRGEIIPYPLVEAESIRIALPDTSKLFNGDWTPNVKPTLEGKVVDYGSQVTFMIPFDTGPIVGSGRIYNTVPKCPVKVGPKTQIILWKFSRDQMAEKLENAEDEKRVRAEKLREEIANHSLDAAMALRTHAEAYVENSYPFEKSDPSLLFKTLTDSFSTGYRVVENPKENPTARGGYSGTIFFALKEEGQYNKLIELQVVATGNQGRVVVGVYSEDTVESTNLLNIIYRKISSLKIGLQERAESTEVKCPICGADLPKEEADPEGYVKCQYCRTQSRLPKMYRH